MAHLFGPELSASQDEDIDVDIDIGIAAMGGKGGEEGGSVLHRSSAGHSAGGAAEAAEAAAAAAAAGRGKSGRHRGWLRAHFNVSRPIAFRIGHDAGDEDRKRSGSVSLNAQNSDLFVASGDPVNGLRLYTVVTSPSAGGGAGVKSSLLDVAGGVAGEEGRVPVVPLKTLSWTEDGHVDKWTLRTQQASYACTVPSGHLPPVHGCWASIYTASDGADGAGGQDLPSLVNGHGLDPSINAMGGGGGSLPGPTVPTFYSGGGESGSSSSSSSSSSSTTSGKDGVASSGQGAAGAVRNDVRGVGGVGGVGGSMHELEGVSLPAPSWIRVVKHTYNMTSAWSEHADWWARVQGKWVILI